MVVPAVAANPPGPVLPDSPSSAGSRSTRSCFAGKRRLRERLRLASRRSGAACRREGRDLRLVDVQLAAAALASLRGLRRERVAKALLGACSTSRWRWTFGGSHGPGGGLVSKAPCGWGRGCRGGSPRAPGTSPHRPGNRSLEPNSEPPLPRGLTTPGTRRLSRLSRSNSGWDAQGPTVPGPAPRRRLT